MFISVDRYPNNYDINFQACPTRMTSLNNIENNVEKVLNRILHPTYNFGKDNEETLNAFVQFLLESGHLIPRDKEIYSKCLVKALYLWKQYRSKPNLVASNVIIKLTAFLSRDEKWFVHLQTQQFFKLIDKITQPINDIKKLSVTVSYLELIDNLIAHDSGLNWIMKGTHWAEIITLIGAEDCDIPVADRGVNTIANLMDKSILIDSSFCIRMVKFISCLITKRDQESKQSNQLLVGNITCAVEILERLLFNFSRDILKIFVDMKLGSICDEMARRSQNEEFVILLDRIILILSFYEMTQYFEGIRVVNRDTGTLSGLLRIIKREAERGFLKTVIKLLYHTHKYWKYIETKVPKYFVKDKSINIADELVALQSYPLVLFNTKLILPEAELVRMLYEEPERSNFVYKLLNKCSANMIHLGFDMKNAFQQHPLYDLEILSVRYLIETRRFLSKTGAGVVFCVFVYTLQDYLAYFPNDKNVVDSNEQLLIDYILDGIAKYAESFDLSWKEALATVNVTDVILALLTLNVWKSEVVVKGLKVLEVVLTKNMSPNLALLVDTSSSSLCKIGPLIYSKCFSLEWKIRKAALNVICTIAYKAHETFPCFKRLLLKYQVPETTFALAFYDKNQSVKATAINCLNNIFRIEDIDEQLCKMDILNKTLQTVAKETNIEIKNNAVVLMSNIYEKENNSENDVRKMYACMAHVAVTESNTEILRNALSFWSKVLDKILINQGMADGSFPPAVFSKEKKKIVILTEDEVKKRLHFALNELTTSGFVMVFMQILKNKHTSKEIMKIAIKIITDFVQLLQQYKVTPEAITTSLYEDYPEIMSIISCDSSDISEEIDNLVTDALRNLMSQDEVPVLSRQISEYSVLPEEFLEFIYEFSNSSEIENDDIDLNRFNRLVSQLFEN